MSQKIPAGYTILRAKRADLFTYMRPNGSVAPEAFPTKAAALDGAWANFRDSAVRSAARAHVS